VVSEKSPDHAWRRVAVFDVMENENPADQAPAEEEDVHRFQVKPRADGRVDVVNTRTAFHVVSRTFASSD
jgi:hypothetical protein